VYSLYDELRYRLRALSQLREDHHPARRRQRLHRLRNALGDVEGHDASAPAPVDAVAHRVEPANMSNCSLNNSSYDDATRTRRWRTHGEAQDYPRRDRERPVNATTPALIAAAAGVGFGHAIMPDHWLPLAIVGRSRRYPLAKVARLSSLAGVAHVLVSLLLGATIVAIGLQFRATVEQAQNEIVGGLLIATGIGFALLELTGRGHDHRDHDHDHDRDHDHEGHREQDHDHDHDHHRLSFRRRGHDRTRGLAAIMVPFGAAASPDLTILPVFLAATTAGAATAAGSLLAFAAVTIATIIALTLLATLSGHQLRGEWPERWGNLITAGVLVALGALVIGGAI
jgi:hypothetical protein